VAQIEFAAIINAVGFEFFANTRVTRDNRSRRQDTQGRSSQRLVWDRPHVTAAS
jgi:hypothetical protein